MAESRIVIRMNRTRFYVYAIYVDGVVRYIGKGSNGRIDFHAIEARRINDRRARGANTDATCSKFYRKLAEAMRLGAVIKAKILIADLTNKGAYRIEKRKIEDLHTQDRTQLWNTIDERFIEISWTEYKRRGLHYLDLPFGRTRSQGVSAAEVMQRRPTQR
jgi:hypothetical protein